MPDTKTRLGIVLVPMNHTEKLEIHGASVTVSTRLRMSTAPKMSSKQGPTRLNSFQVLNCVPKQSSRIFEGYKRYLAPNKIKLTISSINQNEQSC